MLQANIKKALELIGDTLKWAYFVYDGAMGHNAGVQWVRQCDLHIISKLRYDSALYFPYDGPCSGRGPYRKYGERLDYSDIPDSALKSSTIEDGIRTDIYQMIMHHKRFAAQLNVVVIVKNHRETLKTVRVVLFSSDLELALVPCR